MSPRVWRREWKQGSWTRHLSGLTSEPSQAALLAASVERWAQSQQVIPVSHFPLRERDGDLVIRATYGRPYSGLSETSVPRLFSWRTYPDTLLVDSPTSRRIYKAWVTKCRRACTKRVKSVLHNGAAASLSQPWPTVVATDSRASGRHTTKTGIMHHGTSLTDAAREWATPVASLANYHESRETWEARRERMKARKINGNGIGANLGQQAQEWLTPTSRDWKGVTNPDTRRGPQLPDQTDCWAHGRPDGALARTSGPRPLLNPSFVEALMGFPIGWTVCGH